MALEDQDVIRTLGKHGLLDLQFRGGDWPAPTGYDVYKVDWDLVELPFDDEFLDSDPAGDRDSSVSGRRQGGAPPPFEIVDAMAWYQPIHFFGPNWGIYVTLSAVLDIAEGIRQRLPQSRRELAAVRRACEHAALFVLYFHEAFHHKSESAAIKIEIVELRKRYKPYWDSVFLPLRQGDDLRLHEEALASAEMVRRLQESTYRRTLPDDVRRAAGAFCKAWMKEARQRYYRQGLRYLGEEFGSVQDVLLSQLHEAQPTPRRDRADWDLFPRAIQGLFDCRQVTYALVEQGEAPRPWLKRIDPSGLFGQGLQDA